MTVTISQERRVWLVHCWRLRGAEFFALAHRTRQDGLADYADELETVANDYMLAADAIELTADLASATSPYEKGTP